MTTRILDTKKERLIVSILLSLTVPCSAQLAVILGMAAGLSWKVLVLWLGVLVGLTLLIGWAAARVLVKHTQLDARVIAEEAMRVAAGICVYTNEQLTFEEL